MAQLVPQQRCDELQLGEHMPGGTLESTPPPSVPPKHTPPEQVPPPQLMPHAPQWFGSVAKLAHTLPAEVVQQVCPETQAGVQLPGVMPPSPARPPPLEQPSASANPANATH